MLLDAQLASTTLRLRSSGGGHTTAVAATLTTTPSPADTQSCLEGHFTTDPHALASCLGREVTTLGHKDAPCVKATVIRGQLAACSASIDCDTTVLVNQRGVLEPTRRLGQNGMEESYLACQSLSGRSPVSDAVAIDRPDAGVKASRQQGLETNLLLNQPSRETIYYSTKPTKSHFAAQPTVVPSTIDGPAPPFSCRRLVPVVRHHSDRQ